jgi:hypothetical protein
MFKKFMLALGTLGLVVSTPAAAEIRLKPRIEVVITNQPHYPTRNDYRYNPRYENNDKYHYMNINWVKRPRCYYGEVTVKHPRKENRYACLSREEYRRYRNAYRSWQ